MHFLFQQTMRFKKYSSIENSYRVEYLEKLKRSGFDSTEIEYVVQEKVHGANLSFTLSEEETIGGNDVVSIRTAKRSRFIQDDDTFCGYQRVRDRLKPQLTALFTNTKRRFPDDAITTMTVYGELFGGVYSHPQVEPIQNVSKIQMGVDYHPDLGFYAFDILINNETYLSVDAANDLLEEAGLFYARTLFRGTLEDALAYPNDFDSKIGPWLGLPPIAGNMCEGVVIRPATIEPLFLASSGNHHNNKRVILKNKNSKWQENARPAAVQDKKQLPLVANNVTEIQVALQQYLTTNRVRNVMSKTFGNKVTMKDLGSLLKDLMPDAVEDFQKDHGEAWDALPKQDRKRVIKSLNKYAIAQVRTVLNEL